MYVCMYVCRINVIYILNYIFTGSNDSTFKKYVTTVYWASASSTTVGYGDIIPYTDFEVP